MKYSDTDGLAMFQGFTDKASEFLWELSFNNEREWFAAHKGEFEEFVHAPMKELLRELVDGMNAQLPAYGFEGHISRIYRDARRLFGRGPFKDNLWLEIKSADIGKDGPKFWLEIDPRTYSFGMGYYSIDPRGLELFRRGIDANPARFGRLTEALDRHGEFAVYGQSYARAKGSHGESIDRWYNRKSIGCGCERDFGGEILKSELPAYLIKEFKKLMPMYDYLRELYHTEAAHRTEEKP